MIKVLIVDDSGLYRLLLTKSLAEFPDIEVVGAAADGYEAIEMVAALKPDVITLDMNMPRMNGMETLAVLSVKHPSVQVVVVAAENRNDAERAVSILEAGAFDMVLKPKATDQAPMQSLRDALYPRLVAAAQNKPLIRQDASKAKTSQRPGPVASAATLPGNRLAPDIVAVGSSTGGPAALHELFKGIDAPFPIPIIVVQHMPKLFIESLAKRLDGDTKLHCCVAEDGMMLQAGTIYFAPGELHMDIVRAAGGMLKASLHEAEPEHHCRPAVDVTLRSLHALAPAVTTLVVILTGMGRDGAAGARLLADAKAKVIAQDENSSVVWGMPGETVKNGAAHDVLPLNQIAAAINRAATGRPA